MQTDADTLGVDRRAISNPARDRDDLLKRVAADAVSPHLAAVEVTREARWQDVCRADARGLAAAVVESGDLSRHFRRDAPDRVLPVPAEAVLGWLVETGSDDETAARVSSLLTTRAIG